MGNILAHGDTSLCYKCCTSYCPSGDNIGEQVDGSFGVINKEDRSSRMSRPLVHFRQDISWLVRTKCYQKPISTIHFFDQRLHSSLGPPRQMVHIVTECLDDLIRHSLICHPISVWAYKHSAQISHWYGEDVLPVSRYLDACVSKPTGNSSESSASTHMASSLLRNGS